MLRLTAAVMLLATAGCVARTTVAEIRTHPPKATYLSERSTPALEQCLAEGLAHIDPPSVVRGESETVIILAFGMQTDAHLTLKPAGQSTSIEVRSVLPYKGGFRAAVESCV